MGTNYYLYKFCEHCDVDPIRLHIGKSSGGWCFALHVIPELKLNSLDDWMDEIEKSIKYDGYIQNEYCDRITLEGLHSVITDRKWPKPRNTQAVYAKHSGFGNAEQGPNNLVRHPIDNEHCVGHGDGTWDLITGEFE